MHSHLCLWVGLSGIYPAQKLKKHPFDLYHNVIGREIRIAGMYGNANIGVVSQIDGNSAVILFYTLFQCFCKPSGCSVKT